MFHNLRMSPCTALLPPRDYTTPSVAQYQNGASIEDVSALLGHRSIATTATYLARMEGEEDNG